MHKRLFLLGVLTLTLVSCAATAEQRGRKDILTTAQDAGSFTTLLTALEEARMVGFLNGEGPFTVFAPTDQAFAELPEGVLQELLQDRKRLRSVLRYHVTPGQVLSTELLSTALVRTTEPGTTLAFRIEDGGKECFAGDARIVSRNIRCTNGVIHIIDKVLFPQ